MLVITSKKRRGRGLVNTTINNLPVELHIPGYRFYGPGTRLRERLARGDQPINPLDAACLEHDKIYAEHRDDMAKRQAANHVLANQAWQRVKSRDAGMRERAAALAATGIMKAKTKLGLEMKKKMVALRKVVDAAKRTMPVRGATVATAIKSALEGARDAVRKAGGRSQTRTPRILPVPKKVEGNLPAFLIPLFAALSVAGSLAGGGAAIAKAVQSAKVAKEALEESRRHKGPWNKLLWEKVFTLNLTKQD